MEVRETAPDIIQEKIQPLENGGFRFACHPEVPCFTECCRDLNLVLTPYDIMRLKNHLSISSGEFLDRYTDCSFDANRHIPMIYLLMNENERKTCPFVSPKGCSVYGDRPSACRIYPIARASRMHRVHGTVLENYFVLREDHCRGFEEERFWSVDDWLSDQGLEEYYRSNDQWMGIITHPKLRNTGLTSKQQQVFYLASYNLDKFREMALSSRFLSTFELPENEIESVRSGDSALLTLAYNWIRFSLLGEPTFKLR